MTIDTYERSTVAVATPLQGYRDLLSAKDIAEIIGVSVQTAYKEIKRGKFGTPIKFGREYRVPKINILQRYFQTAE